VLLLDVVQNGLQVPGSTLFADIWWLVKLKNAVVIVAGRELRDKIKVRLCSKPQPHLWLLLLEKCNKEPLRGVHEPARTFTWA